VESADWQVIEATRDLGCKYGIDVSADAFEES
jgi:hypothetical protein